MNYQKIYEQLIYRAKTRVLDDYCELHHIIPRCMGGSDDKSNLVELTPEEHYLAHQLLVKIYPTNRLLLNAAVMMIVGRPSNKMYGWLRRRHRDNMSKLQTGNSNSQYGTRWIHNKSLHLSKKIDKNLSLPDGWEEGRIVDFDRYYKKIADKNLLIEERKLKKVLSKEQLLKRIKTKHFLFKKTEGYRRAKSIRLYKEFKQSNLSLRKFAELHGIVPMTLSKWFREFIPEYDIVARLSANKQL